MKQHVFNHERSEIAAFAPHALISEIDGALVMDIPVQATDYSTVFHFRCVWDETQDGEVEDIRVYALSPNFNEIKSALIQSGANEDQVERFFRRDASGNHLMESGSAKSGALAVAYANAHLTLLSQLAEKDELHLLDRYHWTCYLPLFGVNSCGYHIHRSLKPQRPLNCDSDPVNSVSPAIPEGEQ